MTKWLIGILVSSVAMSLVLKLLPENSIKKSVHMTFGIIFLMVTAVPVLNLFSSGIDINGIDLLFKSKVESVSNDVDDKYTQSVISEYSESLNSLAESRILEETGTECKVKVSVCDDADSSYFGKVLNVKCIVMKTDNSKESDKNKDKGVLSDIPIIKDVVISLSKDKKEPKFDSEELCDTLTGLFGITAEQCEIYAGGE